MFFQYTQNYMSLNYNHHNITITQSSYAKQKTIILRKQTAKVKKTQNYTHFPKCLAIAHLKSMNIIILLYTLIISIPLNRCTHAKPISIINIIINKNVTYNRETLYDTIKNVCNMLKFQERNTKAFNTFTSKPHIYI